MGIRMQVFTIWFHKFTISKIYEFSVQKQPIFNFDCLCLRFLKNPNIVNWWIGWIQDSIWLHCVNESSKDVKKILPIGRIWSKIWSQHCRRNIWNLKFNFILQKIFKIKIFRLVDFTIFFKLLWLTNFSFIKIICF